MRTRSHSMTLALGMLWIFPLIASGGPPAISKRASPPTILSPVKALADQLRCTLEFFDVDGCPAFLIRPKDKTAAGPIPWVWYAPVIGHPRPDHAWLLRRWLEKGIGMAGVDVGESHGSPQGRHIYTELWETLTTRYGMSEKPCLLPQSRGGLMLYNWAVENPGRVSCIAGIYAVCDLRSYPGIQQASGAYGLTAPELEAHLVEHNPIDRLSSLAKAGVPILHIHGDADRVVPLEKNAGELARRYRALGGTVRLIVVPGKGHQVCDEFFHCRELADFVIAHAEAGGDQTPGPDMATLERQFRELPMQSRRLLGPLFWLHGDESPERLEEYVEKVAEAGNGSFTAESRPHSDWLGEGWFRDLAICLRAARRHGLKMWIFDEKMWPSQSVGGKVPVRYAARRLDASAEDVRGPRLLEARGHGGPSYIATVAGRVLPDGTTDGATLVDLAPSIRGGRLSWQVPAGNWKVMRFAYTLAPPLRQGGGLSLDGASRDSVDWFLRTVYQPHYERFKDDFGATIAGFFYDEPETAGDWGSELDAVLAQRKVDWKKAYVAYKYRLSGDDDLAARFQYRDALAEAWGRTMYGGMTRWCHAHGVLSRGHFIEHDFHYADPDYCAGDMMRLQSYSDMGGIDMVWGRLRPGLRRRNLYQLPKLASSIAHTAHLPDDVAMCEIFGAYGQDVTYPQMKWVTDQMEVRGVNSFTPHSFNPRAPYDNDCPPYFYNGGFEPRFPLYRVYADYVSRLGVMLSGGRHACPVAVLFSGNLGQVGKMVTPEDMTTALQDAQMDCDWLPMHVFEDRTTLDGREVKLYGERYRVLVVPPVDAIPYGTLSKVKQFYDQGGIVVGYGFLPTRSATIGSSRADISALCKAIWGAGYSCTHGSAAASCSACKTNPAGGRSYLLPLCVTSRELAGVLSAVLPPAVEVLSGETGSGLHVLHRVKAGRDVFLICNQKHQGPALHVDLRFRAPGVPECWDAMRNEIASVPHKVTATGVQVGLTLEPSESVLLVFQERERLLPPRLSEAKPAAAGGVAEPVPLAAAPRDAPKGSIAIMPDPHVQVQPTGLPDKNRNPTLSHAVANPFYGQCTVPAETDLAKARIYLEIDDMAVPSGKLAIREAVYGPAPDREGSPGNWDVTAKIAGIVQDNGLSVIEVFDQTFFDPRAFVPSAFVGKRHDPMRNGLYVEYTRDGKPAVAMAKPGSNLVLPSPVESAVHVTVNGSYAGGFIGRPFRLEVTRYLKKGANRVTIAPFSPAAARLVVY